MKSPLVRKLRAALRRAQFHSDGVLPGRLGLRDLDFGGRLSTSGLHGLAVWSFGGGGGSADFRPYDSRVPHRIRVMRLSGVIEGVLE
jgi:hypothetical protein